MEPDRWVWCRRCEQCYHADWENGQTGTGDSTGCPYWECDNDVGDVLDWKRVRRLHPEFPQVPALAARYHVDGWLWCEACNRCFKFDVDGERCPYSDCPPAETKQVWPWWRIHAQYDNYPDLPERGRRYPQEQQSSTRLYALRREKVSENCFKVKKDQPAANEVVCTVCLTINRTIRNRCFYCGELLPGPKSIGKDLRLGLSWNHPSGAFVVFRG